MSVKLIYPIFYFILIGLVLTSVVSAANVEPQVYVSFDGSLTGTAYNLSPREIDTTGSFRIYNGTEIVSDGLGILTDADQSQQESFQFDASSFNNNGTSFTGTAFVVEAVFTRTDDCDYRAPVIDIGGQCGISFRDGIAANNWDGFVEVIDVDLQPIPEVGRTLHYAIVYDGANIINYYVDGIQIFQSDNGSPMEITPFISWGNIRHTTFDGGRQIIGQYDSVAFSTFTGSFNPDTDFILPGGPAFPERSSNPSPTDGATEVLWDENLSWAPGIFADKHDVYLGTAFEDVNDAERDNPLNVLIVQNHDSNVYHPSKFEFEQTYFWRIDEVNALPDTTIFKGETWSFTVESLAYQIPGKNITATASSYMEGQGPEKTIDGSGLVNDLHSNELPDMWLTMHETGPVWIQYEFDKPYKLHEMLVWNHNGPSILYMYGLKDVTVEYSIDGVNWIQVPDITEFLPATSKEDYAYNSIVAFGDVAAKYVKINASNNWSDGLLDQFGLSEVRFMQIPVSVRTPNPENDAKDVPIDLILEWKKGREAVEHNVYFSEDRQAVIDGTAPAVSVEQASYGPLSLDIGKIYYWRVDEVNNSQTHLIWQGDIWSFSTQECLVVDDFESYNDIPEGQEGSNLVYLTWTDGYDNPSVNGSTIGYITVPSLETVIVHSGKKSVPVMYNNSVASLSEVTVNTSALEIGSDWTQRCPEPKALVISFYGDPNNSTTEQMYVEVNGFKVVHDGSLTETVWQDFSIDLTTLDINLSNVTTLTIGFEKIGTIGGSGTVFIDDIRLCVPLDD